jgi:hypothetical protein
MSQLTSSVFGFDTDTLLLTNFGTIPFRVAAVVFVVTFVTAFLEILNRH